MTPEPTKPEPSGPAVPPPPTRWARTLAYRWFWGLAVFTYALDQYTKHWIAMRLPLGSYGPKHGIRIIRNFFYLVHVGNTGAAWSMFSGMGPVLATLALATLVAIFIWRHQLGLRTRVPQLCFGLLCGGTAGNLTDRLHQGYVTDFLDFHFGSYVYPTFNVADMGVITGVACYVLWSLRQPAPRGQ